MTKNNTQLDEKVKLERHEVSHKIYRVASELNRQIEDAYKKGHPVYLEISANGGFPTVTPISFPRGLYASGKEID
jgi:hypothetical protein